MKVSEIPHADTVALIPAAGRGERLGLGPKAVLNLGGQTLVQHVVTSLANHVSRIIVGAPAELVAEVQLQLGEQAEVIAGGNTRQETIYKLLTHSSEELILVHDANRPFASQALIERVMIAGQDHGAAAAFVQSVNPVALAGNGKIIQSFDKMQMMLSQTPQVYRREVLTAAYAYARQHNVTTQAIWQLVVLSGSEVTVVPGEEQNFKITTLFDLKIAQILVDSLKQ